MAASQRLSFMSSDKLLRYKLTARLTHSQLPANIKGRKNRPWPNLRHFPAIFLDGWRKPTDTPLVTIGKDFWCLPQQANKMSAPPPHFPSSRLLQTLAFNLQQFLDASKFIKIKWSNYVAIETKLFINGLLNYAGKRTSRLKFRLWKCASPGTSKM
jgi:hypothetical protein